MFTGRSLCLLSFVGVLLLILSGCQPEFGSVHAGKKPSPFIAGDSHCVGLAQTTGLKSVARTGAPTKEVVTQLERIPEGVTVIVCAGTNDMPARLVGFYYAVNDVLAAAERRKQRLIWVGPINTPLWWDRYSVLADEYLQSRVPNYVSMRQLWGPGEHDGMFHLTPKGRARLWLLIKAKL